MHRKAHGKALFEHPEIPVRKAVVETQPLCTDHADAHIPERESGHTGLLSEIEDTHSVLSPGERPDQRKCIGRALTRQLIAGSPLPVLVYPDQVSVLSPVATESAAAMILFRKPFIPCLLVY